MRRQGERENIVRPFEAQVDHGIERVRHRERWRVKVTEAWRCRQSVDGGPRNYVSHVLCLRQAFEGFSGWLFNSIETPPHAHILLPCFTYAHAHAITTFVSIIKSNITCSI